MQGPGPAAVSADVYLEATVFVTGLTTTTFRTATWAGTGLPFTTYLTTSVGMSGTTRASLHSTIPYPINLTEVSQTITLDLILDIEGTVHYMPDPSVGGLTALGLMGGAMWLRRRTT